MPFQLSPGVAVVEKDFSSIVPAVATSTGAFAGQFQWGPVEDPVLVTSENQLVKQFGKPNDDVGVFTSFFTAANFLSYSNNLQLVRVASADMVNANSAAAVVAIKNEIDFQDKVATLSDGFYAKYPGEMGDAITVYVADSTSFATWSQKDLFDSAPDAGEFHIAVIDTAGTFTGTAGTVLERFAYVSTTSGTLKADGANNFFKDVVNANSAYVWVAGTIVAGDYALAGGVAGTPTLGELQAGFGIFVNAELYDISLVMVGKAKAEVANFVIDNVVSIRKDCMVLISPEIVGTSTTAAYDGDVVLPTTADKTTKLIAYRNAITASGIEGGASHAAMDSGFKYQYDRYNDVYRWVPMNGDVAGLCARTDATNDAWWSPAGLNRGAIKNIVRLAFNPNATERDELYKNGINPVVSLPGQGTVLFGDKTLLAKPSAFDRINVRRLFIVLEKAIAIAAKYQLFEFNDAFTRAQFKGIVEPFLRDVQGRRGIIDFRCVCDETNNTGEVIDSNQFVADIYIKPARSINFITLTFVAARTAVSFEEIGA